MAMQFYTELIYIQDIGANVKTNVKMFEDVDFFLENIS